jgi:uncharacterized DUF497 family protein
VQYNFEWDPIKAIENLRKHRVGFERAAEVFLDPFALSIYDNEHSRIEDRWIMLGKDSNNVLLVIVHTFRKLGNGNYSLRIISARRATRREAKQYLKR